MASSPSLRYVNRDPNNVVHNSYPSLRSNNSFRVGVDIDVDAVVWVEVVLGSTSEEAVDVEVGTVQ